MSIGILKPGTKPLPKKVLSACQASKLLCAILVNFVRALLSTTLALIRLACGCGPEKCDGVQFFEGVVMHTRSHEGAHAFKYQVRMAIVDLDSPPLWWSAEPVKRLSADEARTAVGTDGPVRLLTTPSCAGYDQNPIQVYYCYDDDGNCRRGICEVTNTPWNHHVYFSFDIVGAELPKPLHVSPLMDLNQSWKLKATLPSPEGLQVMVNVFSGACPVTEEAKPLLRAHLQLTQSSWPRSRAERAASFDALWKYGLQPHRTAVRIYYNAVLLLRKGIKFRGHPPPSYKQCVLDKSRASNGCCSAGLPWWADNEGFPWGPGFANYKVE